MQLMNIGFDNYINKDRILGILSPDSAPVKRLIKEAKEKTILIDASQGRPTKSVILTDCNRIFLSYLPPESLEGKA